MAKLSAKDRKSMPKKEFAGPNRSFPLNDKTHDRMAISGATRSFNAGNISKSTEEKIKSEARSKLGKKPNKMCTGGMYAKGGMVQHGSTFHRVGGEVID